MLTPNIPHDPRLHDPQINNPADDADDYDPAYDPYELIQALERSGFIVIVIDINDDVNDPRLLFGLTDRKFSSDEVVQALKQHEIHISADRLIAASYGNFYEVIF